MTHENDFILLHMEFCGSPRLPLQSLGLAWPPPEFIVFDGEKMRAAIKTDDRAEVFHRRRFSAITDEQIVGMEGRVARGAEYRYVETDVTKSH